MTEATTDTSGLTLLGRSASLPGSPEEAVLERKLLYARHYLAALDIVDPGISHNRGTTLWELHAATSFLANKRFQEERLAPVGGLCGGLA